MSIERVLANAQIVLGDEVIRGGVRFRDGTIDDISTGGAVPAGADDLEGAYLLPGMVDLHTDEMERHMIPRSGVQWPLPVGAILAHDLQIAGAGITTVFDSLSVGTYLEDNDRKALLQPLIEAIHHAATNGLFRINHLVHLRCELSDPDTIDLVRDFIDLPLVQLASLMDHSPARGFRGETSGRPLKARQPASPESRNAVVGMCKARKLRIASHDDTTPDHIAEGIADGITISEFPTTLEAARAARAAGMTTIMGAPNIVRGGSLGGNVAAAELLEAELLDGLSSDYVPASLLQAAFVMHNKIGIPLPQAIAKVSSKIADAVELTDRGEIAVGKRADLLHVHLADGLPVVRQVFRDGDRVV